MKPEDFGTKLIPDDDPLVAALRSLDVVLKDRNGWRERARCLALLVKCHDAYDESVNVKNAVDDIMFFYEGKIKK